MTAVSYYNVADSLIFPDGSDCTTKLQGLVNTVALKGGGTIFFPAGQYRLTAPIDITGPNIRLQGTGKRNGQNQAIQPLISNWGDVPSTLFIDHNGNAFNLSHKIDFKINGFGVNRLTLVGRANYVTARAFAFNLGGPGDFRRDFIFEEMAASLFQTVFDLYAVPAEQPPPPPAGGSEGTAGVIRVVRCSINNNVAVAQTNDNKHWNEFVFHQNESGQNQSGIRISGSCISITDNVLEGTGDPIRVSGSYRSLEVRNNYFERCVGTACIWIQDSLGPWVVGPNFYFNIADPATQYDPPKHHVLAQNTGRGVSHDPVWYSRAINVTGPDNGNVTAAPDLGVRRDISADISNVYVRVDTDFTRFTRAPSYKAIVHGYEYGAAVPNPLGIEPLPGTSGMSSSAGAGSPFPVRSLSAATTDWVVSCLPLRRLASPMNADVYLIMQLNPGAGRWEGPIYNYFNLIPQGEWALITIAMRPTVAVTSVELYWAAYVNPNATYPPNLGFECRPPLTYVVDDPNRIRPYFDPEEARKVDGIPSSSVVPPAGTRFIERAPTPGGWTGYVRTASAWTSFGAVST